MDRNTLLAFLLISVVLIFTPKYMDLVSPPSNVEEIEVFNEPTELTGPVNDKVIPSTLLPG